MQVSFNIIKKTKINDSFRTKKIKSDFDYKQNETENIFHGIIETPKKWNIGCIVGASGTGKSTIAKEKFGKYYVRDFVYDENSVLDNMNENCTVEEITKMFYRVGFSSVPDWLKPYNLLSTGQKMRVDVARALLQNNKVVYDEFTSVVDRTVAKNLCIALNKYLKQSNKKFIAVSCHKDIIEYLQPDWIFDTDTMQMVFVKAPDQNKNSQLENAKEWNGANLGTIII